MSNPLTLISGDIYALKGEFQAVLSDPSINFEREAEFAMQLLEANDYALKVALGNRQSVINAIKNIAAIGISLNPAKKQAYLVPRRPRPGAAQAICLDLSYMGLLDLAVASGSIRWGQAKLVRENDVYEAQGVDKAPLHKYAPFKQKDRGAVIGVYVVVKTADGDFLTHEMSLDEVFDIRDRSESWKSYVKDNTKKTPWMTDFGEMVKKTVIKQASKTWPKGSGRLEQAIHHLNTDGGEGLVDINPQPDNAVDVAPMIAAALKTKTDADALKYWRDNNAALVGQPQDHKRLKDVIAGHRAKMAADDALRTVDMEPTTPPMTDAEIEAADLARTVTA